MYGVISMPVEIFLPGPSHSLFPGLDQWVYRDYIWYINFDFDPCVVKQNDVLFAAFGLCYLLWQCLHYFILGCSFTFRLPSGLSSCICNYVMVVGMQHGFCHGVMDAIVCIYNWNGLADCFLGNIFVSSTWSLGFVVWRYVCLGFSGLWGCGRVLFFPIDRFKSKCSCPFALP